MFFRGKEKGCRIGRAFVFIITVITIPMNPDFMYRSRTHSCLRPNVKNFQAVFAPTFPIACHSRLTWTRITRQVLCGIKIAMQEVRRCSFPAATLFCAGCCTLLLPTSSSSPALFYTRLFLLAELSHPKPNLGVFHKPRSDAASWPGRSSSRARDQEASLAQKSLTASQAA